MSSFHVSTQWYSHRLHQDIRVSRYGFVGQPVLLFPTAGGDAEECERFQIIRALSSLFEAGRVKIYSCDSASGRAWTNPSWSGYDRAAFQTAFHHFVIHELVPAIYQDCRAELPVIVAGASLGAYNALAAITRSPQFFSKAICMSGTFDIQAWSKGDWSMDFYYSSPLHFVPNLQGKTLEQLQDRFIVIPTGDGDWEEPEQSYRVAHVLGSKGIPHRLDMWHGYAHDWITWREMLPQYLDQLLP
ncbi:MAG: alpha/beta hydrolase-fold protein [Myxococcota bacterium]